MQFHKKKQNENKHLLKLFFTAREKEMDTLCQHASFKRKFLKEHFC